MMNTSERVEVLAGAVEEDAVGSGTKRAPPRANAEGVRRGWRGAGV